MTIRMAARVQFEGGGVDGSEGEKIVTCIICISVIYTSYKVCVTCYDHLSSCVCVVIAAKHSLLHGKNY